MSIIGIGTLALFSGLITVGFLDQLKLYREQRGKTTVAVSEKTISITQSFREQSFRERVGEARDLAELPDLPARVSQRGEILPARAGICPHCGSVFAAAPRGATSATSRSVRKPHSAAGMAKGCAISLSTGSWRGAWTGAKAREARS